MSTSDCNIGSLEDVAALLETEGYEYFKDDEAVRIKIGGSENPLVGVITINTVTQELSVTCKVAKLGEIPEENIPQVFAACLDANTRITPYAFGLITSSDNPELDDEKEWPIVLVDSVPLGDLCENEFKKSLDSLWVSLESSREVLVSAFNQV